MPPWLVLATSRHSAIYTVQVWLLLLQSMLHTLYDGQPDEGVEHLPPIPDHEPDVETVTAGWDCRQLQADRELMPGHSSQPGVPGVRAGLVARREGGELSSRGGEEEGGVIT